MGVGVGRGVTRTINGVVVGRTMMLSGGGVPRGFSAIFPGVGGGVFSAGVLSSPLLSGVGACEAGEPPPSSHIAFSSCFEKKPLKKSPPSTRMCSPAMISRFRRKSESLPLISRSPDW